MNGRFSQRRCHVQLHDSVKRQTGERPAGSSQNTGPAASRTDLRRQNTVGVASRAAAANEAGNQRHRRRLTARNHQSQTFRGRGFHDDAVGETRPINTSAEQQIVSVCSTELSAARPTRDRLALDSYTDNYELNLAYKILYFSYCRSTPVNKL